MSGFGPKAIDLAARIADGFVTVAPDRDAIERFRSQAPGDRVVQGGLKVCWDEDESRAARTLHRLWPNDALPGELAQILPTPRHFEQATELVTEEMLADATPCGPDLDRHLNAIREFAKAGFDELYIQQIGPHQDAFFEIYRAQVLPRVREELSAGSPA
jgi:G6PDH family F420-dependent oxidoreductase